MASTSYGHHPGHDLELQQTLPLIANKSPRARWRWVFLILQAHQILIATGSSLKKASATHSRVISSSSSYSSIDSTEAINGDAESVSQETVVDMPCEDENHLIARLQHEKISRIVKAKDLESLNEFGGVKGVADALETNTENGIPDGEEKLCWRRIDPAHHTTQIPRQGFFVLILKSANNYIIILLFISAALSIGFGIKQKGTETGWYEGVIIINAMIILLLVPAIREYCLEGYLKHSKEEKQEIMIDVIRGGFRKEISVSNVLLGDVLFLERGNQLPADGLYISGENLILDDCSETIIDDRYPFLFYGAKVMSGNGCMLVTSVGTNIVGEMMREITLFKEARIQAQLDKVNTSTQISALVISILIMVILFLRPKLGKEDENSDHQDLKGKPTAVKDLVNAIQRVVMKPSGKISILTVSLTMLLVGITEGLPVVVTLAITYWNKMVLRDKAIAQDLQACVNTGSVTTICAEPSGGLLLNPYEVDMFCIGGNVLGDSFVIAADVLEAICDGISKPVQSPCTLMDTSLISWAELNLGRGLENLKQKNTTIIEIKKLSGEERTGMLMKKNGEMHLHWKGHPATVLAMCSSYYDSEGKILTLNQDMRQRFEDIINLMRSKNLRGTALAYKHTKVHNLEENNLIFLGMVGLKTGCRVKTKEAVEACKRAGINVVLMSGDNLPDLEAIAHECSILVPNSEALLIKGEDFQNSSIDERMNMVDKISVMGNSSPHDKLLLVQCLKQKGQTVAAVGFRADDIPAMKEADVGLTTEEWSTNLAKKISDIIIKDGGFSSLITILSSGRCIYDNIQKYIQLELTMILVGLLMPCITTICSGESPISAIQLSWAYLVAAVPGGLALLTEFPSRISMEKPVRSTKPLINKPMWRNISVQALNRIAILLTIQFKGEEILHISEKIKNMIIFNSLVLCQVFGRFSSRALEDKHLIIGMHRNRWFWIAASFTVALQAAYIEVAHKVAGNAKLTVPQWGMCALIGIISCMADFAVRCLSILLAVCLIEPIIRRIKHSGN